MVFGQNKHPLERERKALEWGLNKRFRQKKRGERITVEIVNERLRVRYVDYPLHDRLVREVDKGQWSVPVDVDGYVTPRYRRKLEYILEKVYGDKDRYSLATRRLMVGALMDGLDEDGLLVGSACINQKANSLDKRLVEKVVRYTEGSAFQHGDWEMSGWLDEVLVENVLYDKEPVVSRLFYSGSFGKKVARAVEDDLDARVLAVMKPKPLGVEDERRLKRCYYLLMLKRLDWWEQQLTFELDKVDGVSVIHCKSNGMSLFKVNHRYCSLFKPADGVSINFSLDGMVNRLREEFRKPYGVDKRSLEDLIGRDAVDWFIYAFQMGGDLRKKLRLVDSGKEL